MNYGYTKQVALSFTDTVRKTKEELAKEGFGILTEIDVKATLKKKLGADWDNYMILGACNPALSYRALQAEKEIGLLLPCNVIVYEDRGSVFVSVILPTAAMQMVDNEDITAIGREVESKLRTVVNGISNE